MVGAAFFMAHGLTGCIGAGINSELIVRDAATFPAVSGINLNGQTIEIPRGLSGSIRVVVVAFEQRQQGDVDTWINALAPDLAAERDLALYELPVIYTGSAPFRFWVNNGMRSGITDETARNRTITVYTDREKFYAALGVQQGSITTFILAPDDTIAWRADGPASRELLAGARSAIEAVRKEVARRRPSNATMKN
jgi:hypothetical protein